VLLLGCEKDASMSYEDDVNQELALRKMISKREQAALLKAGVFESLSISQIAEEEQMSWPDDKAPCTCGVVHEGLLTQQEREEHIHDLIRQHKLIALIDGEWRIPKYAWFEYVEKQLLIGLEIEKVREWKKIAKSLLAGDDGPSLAYLKKIEEHNKAL
jgi:hypothetical protein